MLALARVSLVLGAATLFLVHAWHYRSRWTDDAYISFRYARNFWQGHGMAMNPGERLEGITNLGWTLLLAPTTGGDPLTAAKILGLLCGVGTVLALLYWSRRLDPAAAVIAMVPVVAVPWLPFWSQQGMETSAVAFALTLGWTRLQDEQEAIALGQSPRPLGVLALAVAPWLRPDSVPVVAVVGLWFLFSSGRKGLAHAGRSAAVLLVSAGLLVGVKLALFGEILPNTFHVKSSTWPWREGQQYLLSFLQVPWTPFSIGAVVAMLWALTRPVVRLPGLVALVVLVVAWLNNGDFFASFRFLVPALPALGACLGLIGQELICATPRPAGGRLAALGLAAVIAGRLPLVDAVEGIRDLARFPRSAAVTSMKRAPLLRPWQGHEQSIGYAEQWSFPAAWILAHARAEDTVAFTDIGLFSWVAENPVVDLLGLTDRVMAGRVGGSPPAVWAAQQAYLLESVDWLILDRKSGRWPRYEAFFRDAGWEDVDGCDSIRVLRNPRLAPSEDPLERSVLEARFARLLAITPGHTPLHTTVLRELVAVGADPAFVSRAFEQVEERAEEGLQPGLSELHCALGLDPGCTPRADQCGSALSRDRGFTGATPASLDSTSPAVPDRASRAP